jgi:hypothetical protein
VASQAASQALSPTPIYRVSLEYHAAFNEMSLHVLAYYFKRMLQIFGTQQLIQMMKT